MSEPEKEYELAEITRQAKKILRQNAVYVRYPLMDDKGDFTGEEAAHLYIIFDKQKEGLAQQQELIMENYLQGGLPHRFTNSSIGYIHDRDQKDPDVMRAQQELLDHATDAVHADALNALVQAHAPFSGLQYDMTPVRKEFEQSCLGDIGTIIEPSHKQMKALFDREAATRKEITARFGEQESVDLEKIEDLCIKHPAMHDRWAKFFEDAEHYLDPKGKTVKESDLERDGNGDFAHYRQQEDGVLIPRPLPLGERYTKRDDGVINLKAIPRAKELLRPAVRIRPVSEVVNELGEDLFLEARKAKAGVDIEYPITRQHSRQFP